VVVEQMAQTLLVLRVVQVEQEQRVAQALMDMILDMVEGLRLLVQVVMDLIHQEHSQELMDQAEHQEVRLEIQEATDLTALVLTLVVVEEVDQSPQVVMAHNRLLVEELVLLLEAMVVLVNLSLLTQLQQKVIF
jgi:plastocyanin domain-containing protein